MTFSTGSLSPLLILSYTYGRDRCLKMQHITISTLAVCRRITVCKDDPRSVTEQLKGSTALPVRQTPPKQAHPSGANSTLRTGEEPRKGVAMVTRFIGECRTYDRAPMRGENLRRCLCMPQPSSTRTRTEYPWDIGFDLSSEHMVVLTINIERHRRLPRRTLGHCD